MNKSVADASEMKRLYSSYLMGFLWSVILTLFAFALVKIQSDSSGQAYSPALVIGIVVGLALIQLVVQLLFFFHLGREQKPRLNTISFLFMLMVVSIIAFGSLWIMYNLNYNMMGKDVQNYDVQSEENIHTDTSTHHH